MRMQEVAGEGILLAGGAAAILLQVADPRVAAGVARHSDFAERPLDRLHGTLTYLYVLAYGTADEQHRVARLVGEAHRPVPGARDAELQRWVAATLYWTAARIHELVLEPVDEELYQEYARIGTALGMPTALWPAGRAAFEEYFEGYPLAVGDDARQIAHDLLHPSRAPWWMRRLLPTVRLATAGLLPAALRDAYALEFDAARYARLVARARRWYARLPRALRELPMRRTLRAFRRAYPIA
jgi:uncharacterized protein (DUF2236 family)